MVNDKKEYYLESDGTKNYDKKIDGSYKKGLSPQEKENHFKPGNTEGGRPKGSKNRSTLRRELLEKGGLSPAEFLLTIMHDENVNLRERKDAAKELMAYTETKLQSIELTGELDVETNFNLILNLGEDDDK